MDAAIPVDAKNAPTGIWKTAQNAVFHSAHTHHRISYEEDKRPKQTTLINLSTDSDQVHGCLCPESKRTKTCLADGRRLVC